MECWSDGVTCRTTLQHSITPTLQSRVLVLHQDDVVRLAILRVDRDAEQHVLPADAVDRRDQVLVPAALTCRIGKRDLNLTRIGLASERHRRTCTAIQRPGLDARSKRISRTLQG